MFIGETAGASDTILGYNNGNEILRYVSTGQPPAILSQPASLTVNSKTFASFSVKAAGSPELGFAWYNGSSSLVSTAGDSLYITNAQAADFTNYFVVVSNGYGAVTSQTAWVYLDSNRDDLPDVWQMQHFGSLSNTRAWYDSDQDGVCDGDEWKDGTDPTNAASRFYRFEVVHESFQGGWASCVPYLPRYPPGTVVDLQTASTGNEFYAWSHSGETNQHHTTTVTNDTTTVALFRGRQTVAWGAGVVPPAATNVIAMFAGINGVGHAILRNGSVTGWGNNANGQASPPANATNLVNIENGDISTLALRADGRIIRWGSASGVDVSTFSNIVALSVGRIGGVRFAVRADGSMFGFGNGLAGNDDTGQLSYMPGGLTDVVQVAVGRNQCMALRKNGTVLTWGGSGGRPQPAGLSNVVAISCGNIDLALQSDGTVVTWGSSYNGLDTIPAHMTNVALFSAREDDDVWSAILPDGRLAAHGENTFGQISVQPWLVRACDVSCGGTHTLALMSIPEQPLASWLSAYEGTNGAAVTAHGLYFDQVTNVTVRGVNAPFTLQDDRTLTFTVPAGASGIGRVDLQASNGLAFVRRCFVGLDAGAAPTNVVLLPNSFPEESPTGTPVGALVAQDPDAFDYFRFSFVSGVGADDNVLFSIVSNGLVTATNTFNYETRTNYSVRVRCIDAVGNTLDQALTVLVSNITTDDADGDGLTEAQELAAGTNPNVVDTDGDGWRDNLEYYSGSQPTNSLSQPLSVVVTWGTSTGVMTNMTNAISALAPRALREDGVIPGWPSGISNIVAMRVGNYQTIGLRPSGVVTSYVTDVSQGLTIAPASLSNVVAVSAGRWFGAALRADGTVSAWGRNNESQVSSATNIRGAIAISAYSYHGVAVLTNGSVQVWGYPSSPITNVPSGLSGVVAASVGASHCLALLSNGTVAAWGVNSAGQTSVPAGLSNVVAVSAGDEFSLAAKADGSIIGWGRNLSSELNVPSWLSGCAGLDSLGQYSTAIMTVPGAPFIGGLSAIRVTTGDTVRIWGARLDTVTNVVWGDASVPFTVLDAGLILVTAPTNVQSLARIRVESANGPGYARQMIYTIGVSGPPTGVNILPATFAENCASGTVVGAFVAVDPDPGDTFTYTLVAGVGDADNGLFAITNGLLRTIVSSNTFNYEVRSNYSIRVRTSDGSGQVESIVIVSLTNILTDDDDADGYTEAQELAQGTNPLKADTDDDGWTEFFEYSMGTDPTNAASRFDTACVEWKNPPYFLGFATSTLALAAGENFSLYLRADGVVTSWGSASFPPYPTNMIAVDVSAGRTHGMLLRTNGLVTCWGGNSSGQTNVPVSLSNVVAIAAGYNNSVALRADGTVTNWGSGVSGQISGSNFVAVAAGGNHALALRKDGSVAGWGNNTYGQITIPATVTNAIAIAAGETHSLAVLSNGTVVAWGRNNSGQCTVPAGASNNAVAVAAGRADSLVLLQNGTIVGFGYNLTLGDFASKTPAWFTNGVMVSCGYTHTVGMMMVPQAAVVAAPSSRQGRPGEVLRLPGTRLSSVTSVTVGGVPASFSLVSDSLLDVTIPYGASGLCRVKLTGSNYFSHMRGLYNVLPFPGYNAWIAAVTNGLTNYNESAAGDGYPNLLKYATGSSPTNSDNFASLSASNSAGLLALRFYRNTNALDLTLTVEGSYSITNGSPWDGLATNRNGSWGSSTNVTESGAGTPASVTVQDTTVASTNRYLRLRVTRP